MSFNFENHYRKPLDVYQRAACSSRWRHHHLYHHHHQQQQQQPDPLTGLRFFWKQCSDCCSCLWPPPERRSSASPGRTPPGRPGPASPRCSGRAGGFCTTTAPGGTAGPPSPTTARTSGSESCSRTRNTPRVRSKTRVEL